MSNPNTAKKDDSQQLTNEVVPFHHFDTFGI